MSSSTIRLDASNTSVSFAVRWFGAIIVRGDFRALNGALHFPEPCLDGASLRLDVVAGSVRTGIALRDRHLRGPRFLHAARHPCISFRSARIERRDGGVAVAGMLTLRGREAPLLAQCVLREPDDDGAAPRARVSARFDVARHRHQVGSVAGLQRFNPLMLAIGSDITVEIRMLLPANRLPPLLRPVPAR